MHSGLWVVNAFLLTCRAPAHDFGGRLRLSKDYQSFKTENPTLAKMIPYTCKSTIFESLWHALGTFLQRYLSCNSQQRRILVCLFVGLFIFIFLGAGPGWFPVAGCFLLIQSLHCVNGAETTDRFDSISLYTTLEQPKRKFPVFSLSSSVLLSHFREKLVFHRFFSC